MMVTPHGAKASIVGSSFVIDGKTFRQQPEYSCRQKDESLFVSTGCRWFVTHLHPRKYPFGGVPQNDRFRHAELDSASLLSHRFAGDDVLHRLRNGLLMPVTPHGAIASIAGSSFVIDGKTFRQQSEDSCRQKDESLFVSTGCRWLPAHLHPRKYPFGGMRQNDRSYVSFSRGDGGRTFSEQAARLLLFSRRAATPTHRHRRRCRQRFIAPGRRSYFRGTAAAPTHLHPREYCNTAWRIPSPA